MEALACERDEAHRERDEARAEREVAVREGEGQQLAIRDLQRQLQEMQRCRLAYARTHPLSPTCRRRRTHTHTHTHTHTQHTHTTDLGLGIV